MPHVISRREAGDWKQHITASSSGNQRTTGQEVQRWDEEKGQFIWKYKDNVNTTSCFLNVDISILRQYVFSECFPDTPAQHGLVVVQLSLFWDKHTFLLHVAEKKHLYCVKSWLSDNRNAHTSPHVSHVSSLIVQNVPTETLTTANVTNKKITDFPCWSDVYALEGKTTNEVTPSEVLKL